MRPEGSEAAPVLINPPSSIRPGGYRAEGHECCCFVETLGGATRLPLDGARDVVPGVRWPSHSCEGPLGPCRVAIVRRIRLVVARPAVFRRTPRLGRVAACGQL